MCSLVFWFSRLTPWICWCTYMSRSQNSSLHLFRTVYWWLTLECMFLFSGLLCINISNVPTHVFVHSHYTQEVIHGVQHGFLQLQNCGGWAPCSCWHTISGASAICMYAYTKVYCNNVCCSSPNACMTPLLQPRLQWASIPGTLMSSLCSGTLQHLCSKRALEACKQCPRLVTKSLTPLAIGSNYKMHVKFKHQNATQFPKRRGDDVHHL